MDLKNCVTPARCLFPSQMTSFSVGDIMKADTADDFGSDDSGTDALYIAEDESHEQSTPVSDDSACKLADDSEYRSDSSIDSNEKIQTVKKEPVSAQEYSSVPLCLKKEPAAAPERGTLSMGTPVVSKTPLISDYPPPSIASYPIGAFNPMFMPGMFSSPHPGIFNHQPFYPYLSPQIAPQLPVMPQAIQPRCESESSYSRVSPPSDGRSSPADSVASSGNSSTRSPSPRVPSPQEPEVSPRMQTPTRTRTTNGRTCYNQRQVRAMETLFAENRYPDYEVLEKMSSDIGIPVKKIKVWFQNKRARNKTRASDVSPHTMAAMMSSAAAYGYMGPTPIMPFPYPVSTSSLVYPGYPYPAMYSSPMC